MKFSSNVRNVNTDTKLQTRIHKMMTITLSSSPEREEEEGITIMCHIVGIKNKRYIFPALASLLIAMLSQRAMNNMK